MNQNTIDKLKANAEELSPLETVTSSINELLKLSSEDKIYVMKINGKTLYSFMTEDEMYQIMFNKSKEEYNEVVKKREQRIKEDEAREKAECEEALKTKFPKLKKLIEESFPKAIAEDKIKSFEADLLMGDFDVVKSIDTWINLLEAAKTKPMREAQKVYLGISNNAGNRLHTCSSLAGSFYSDIFINLIIKDSLEINKVAFANTDEKLLESKIAEIVAYYRGQAEAARPEAEAFFAKEDAKNILKSRLKKPIEESIKRGASQKSGNNLGALWGETSEKGKTQKGIQKY